MFSGGSPPEPLHHPGTATLPRPGVRHHRAPTRERELERTNRLYAILSAVNRTILRVTTREDLFREICRITVEHVGFKVVWVGWHDPETHAVVPIASAGDQEGYLDGIKVYADERPEGRGPVGVCVRTGRPCIIHDFVGDPRAKPWRERAIAHGLRSAAALPLRLGGEICGVFIVYAGEKDVFKNREVGLLQEIADSVSFAMDYLDQEKMRRQAEECLRHREAQYRAVIETCADGFWMANKEDRILEVNDAYVRRSGYRREELVGMHFSDLEANEQPAETAARILRIRQMATDLFETLHRAKDGTVWPVEVNAAYWPAGDGRWSSSATSPRGKRPRRRSGTSMRSLELVVARRTAKMKSMLANATIGLAFFDRDIRYLRINRCLAEINGIPADAHLGRPLSRVASRRSPRRSNR